MRINDKLNSVIKFISGGVAYSLVDKVINYNSAKAEDAAQAIRDQKLDNIQSDVNLLGNFVKDNLKVIKECREAYGNRNNVVIDKDVALTQLNDIKANGTNILSKLTELKVKQDWNIDNAYEDFVELLLIRGVDDFISIVNGNDTTNKFVSGVSDIFQFVENLSILQHSVLLDILLFILLILTVINILSALFGNEIIKYFNLEKRFPRLSLFFKVRASLQRYYLMWNVFILMFVCLFGVCINMMVLALTLELI